MTPTLIQRWSTALTPKPPTRLPALCGSIVAVAGEKEVVGLEAETGEVRWRSPVKAEVSGVVALKDRFYVLLKQGRTDTLQIFGSDGTLLKERKVPIDVYLGSLLLWEDRIVVYGARYKPEFKTVLGFLDPESGAVADEMPWYGRDPVSHGDTVVGWRQGRQNPGIARGNLVTGEVTTLSLREADGVAFDGETVLASGESEGAGCVIAVDLASGEELWEAPSAFHLYGMAIQGGIALHAEKMGTNIMRLWARNARTGEALWHSEPQATRAVGAMFHHGAPLGFFGGVGVFAFDPGDGRVVGQLPLFSTCMGCGLSTPAGLFVVDPAARRLELAP